MKGFITPMKKKRLSTIVYEHGKKRIRFHG